jgi:hypothetical protein
MVPEVEVAALEVLVGVAVEPVELWLYGRELALVLMPDEMLV